MCKRKRTIYGVKVYLSSYHKLRLSISVIGTTKNVRLDLATYLNLPRKISFHLFVLETLIDA